MNELTAPTEPYAGVIRTDVSLGGVPIAVGDPGDPAGAPYVSSGLSVRWGRQTTVEQPPPATASFSVFDHVGSAAWRRRCMVGAPVAITSSATSWADPTVSTHFDPSFTSYADGAAAPGRADRAIATVQTLAGRKGVRLRPTISADVNNSAGVQLPPRPFSAALTAWDAVPRMLAGQRWRITVSLRVPAYHRAVVTPLRYTDPDGKGVKQLPWIGRTTPLTSTVTEAWANISGDVVADAGGWLGLEVRLIPEAATWDTASAAWTWNSNPLPATWDTAGDLWIDDLLILAPPAGGVSTVAVFSGRVTDVQVTYAERIGATVYDVTAADFTADLGNRYIGDDPWPAEPASTRVGRIMAAAGLTMPVTVDPRPGALNLSRADIDRQSVLSLLSDVATSTDAVLRAAVHPTTGAYLRVEDTAGRPALLQIAAGAGGIWAIFPVAVLPAGAVSIPADLVELDSTSWRQDVADVATRVTVTWQEQTTPDTTERTVQVLDSVLLAQLGDRAATVSSQLISATDAAIIGQQILTRLSGATWRVSDLLIRTDLLDPDPATTAIVLALLDGTRRIGLPVQVAGAQAWAPTPSGAFAVYVEGGALQNIDGCWLLTVNASSNTGIGRSARWNEAPAGWTWNNTDPTITWNDLIGVGT